METPKKKTPGGLGGIKVKQKSVKKGEEIELELEPKPEPELEPKAEPESEPEPGEVSQETIEVNKAIIETACVAVSRIAVALTGIEEIAFDESEVEQLKSLWSPFVPNIPPVAGAIIGTVIIVGGKVGIYAIKRKGTRKIKQTKGQKSAKTKAEGAQP